MKVKNTVSLLLLCVALILTGCSGKKTDEPDGNPSATVTPNAEPIKEENVMTATPEPTAEVSPTVTPVPTSEDGIVLKCPVEMLKRRTEVIYSKFTHETYYSELCKRERGITVLLPADYSEEKKYPVLYLLHGIFGDENSFAGDANLPVLFGNLFADGVCDEFIVVCPHMYCASDETDQAPDFKKPESLDPYDRIGRELKECLIPYINGKYSVIEGREGTYLAGFSMGGRETLYTFLQYPDQYRFICAIAPAPGILPAKDMFMEHAGCYKNEEDVKVPEGSVLPDKILILCGTKDSVVGKFPMNYHQVFEKNGIAHIWYEVPGADHDMTTQYSGIYNLLRVIGGKVQ